MAVMEQLNPIVTAVPTPQGFEIREMFAAPIGNFLYNVDLTLRTREDAPGPPANLRPSSLT